MYNASELRDKIAYEGGVLDALEYGITPEDIEDDELATAWNELLQQMEQFEDAAERFDDLLYEKADQLGGDEAGID